MSLIKDKLKEPIDWILVLLFSLVVALFFLFIYLQNIDTTSKYYYAYKKNVERLHLYNQKLDNVFISTYRYLDNDEITIIEKKFDHALISLEKNPLTKVFGKKVIDSLHIIIKKYEKKVELIEGFKTRNARVTGSVYYLDELKRQIQDNQHIDMKEERLLSNILFKMEQVFLDTNFDHNIIANDLKKLHAYKAMDEDIYYFIRHVDQFLVDTKGIDEIIKHHKLLKTSNSIDTLSDLLEKKYIYNQDKEEVIGTTFFLFAFLVLISLIYTYLKVRKQKKEVYYLAYHDTLTDLPNRTEFERYIHKLIEKRRKGFVLFFIDLDRFKGINDTLGHDIGDEMLIVLAQRIFKVLGSENFLARIGGDEFVAIIRREEDIKNIQVLAENVASTIRKPIRINDYSLSTTASIGIAKYPEDGGDKSTLLRHADSAMYHAKDRGRDTYAFYTKQLSVEVERRLELEQELVHALNKKEFTLYYQPQYALSTGEITGVEALVRWDNSVLGAVSPEEFICIAEDTGLIVELGYYIFEEACRTYVTWINEGVDIDLIAINMSSIQLRQIDALERFEKIIELTGIDAKHIEIELTERYIMEYTTEKLTILDDLRSLGCRISIDDFGTGYSSMSYLKSLSIDTIKIDKSFILDLPDNQHDSEVSKAIIVLSQSLGYSVIAEGIENIEQENLLKKYNCDMGQGFYFAKPMKGDKIVSFYHENSKKVL